MVAGAGVTAPQAAPVASPPVHSASFRAGPNDGYGAQSSLNWAGYGVSGGVFTKAAGSWTQPKATCPTKVTTSQGSAFWVGLDGLAAKDPTVEQVGTDSDCVKGAGASYYAWFQMYPKAAFFLPTSKYPVVPGETIDAQVSVAAKVFTLTISAASGGVAKWHFSTSQAESSALQSSAELITEAPCVGSPCKIVPLTDFGTVNFTGASFNGKAISSAGFTVTKLTMTTSGSKTVKARPSSLASGGTGFSVTWLHG
jgi:hypothetical protein